MTMVEHHSDRFDYMGRASRKRLIESMRSRRLRALDAISEYLVSYMGDDDTRGEAVFARQPTPEDIFRAAGGEVQIISVEKRRQTNRSKMARPQLLAI